MVARDLNGLRSGVFDEWTGSSLGGMVEYVMDGLVEKTLVQNRKLSKEQEKYQPSQYYSILCKHLFRSMASLCLGKIPLSAIQMCRDR